MGTMGGGDGGNISKFPNRAARWRESAGFERKGTNLTATPQDPPQDEAVPEPLSEQERLDISKEMDEILTPIALRHPTWNITEEVIESKVGLLLIEANNNPAHLVPYLEYAAHNDVVQSREILILHLAAARAYLDLLELHKREDHPDL
ncbi:hypothetical protein A3A40_03525 [Candidatus Kaiserbacteria bacterium RIFCSPLOWO2_01_FULL_54_20]|uniref:Uncharacterized protein n=1 Tax=Candidatus Kaiserbacteria bacterium RIFCSPLOWO2_01_FULL_54_20 TaxID=1798513 RepID=A0A1F6EJY8_9BACT|nr:MAG: hypothetical protein A3A40_03525 [Candidatus Kaiserbacteria bacterium RIFCSPLOWO2_01_FULL_54_20]